MSSFEPRDLEQPERLPVLRPLAVALLCLLAFVLAARARPNAELWVEVTPLGAEVILRTPSDQETQPWHVDTQLASEGVVRFAGLRAGQVMQLRVAAPGYQGVSRDLSLPAGGGVHRVTLRLAREDATVTLRSTPSGARVWWDGAARGVTPALIDGVLPGEHRLELQLEGYAPLRETLELRPGEVRELSLQLLSLPDAAPPPSVASAGEGDELPAGHGWLRVTSTHAARFFLNQAVLGFGTEARRAVPAGRHRVLARADGRGSQWHMVTLEEGASESVAFAFDEDPVDKAIEATNPMRPLHWIIRGGNVRGEGQFGAAVDAFRHALTLEPSPEEEIEIHRQLSRTLPGMQRWEEAIFHAETFLSLAPDAPDAPFTRQILEELRRRKKSESPP